MPVGYATTYYTVGNREGLTDTVADLFADETPLFSMSRKVRAIATKHEWQADNLGAADGTPIVEGVALSYTEKGRRVRPGNYTHIRLRNWDVSFTQMAVKVAGIKSEVARAVLKSLKEIATDYEKILLATGAASAGITDLGRQSRGLGDAITSNTGAGTGTGLSAVFQLTEDCVNLRMQEIWDAGGDPRALFCGGHNKRVISKKFTAKTGFSFNINASTRQAIANINKYEGSFGTLDIIPDRQCEVRRIIITTPDQIKIAVLRDIQQYKGAPTASSLKGWCEAEMCLEYGNQKGHAQNSLLKHSGTIA